MNIAFAACVIGLHLGALVCGDLEIYPGGEDEDNFNLPDEQAAIFSKLYLDPKWRASVAWNNEREPQPHYLNIRERMNQLENFVKHRRQQLREQAAKDPYLSIGLPLNLPYNNYRSQFNYQNQPILDDVRPYPPEDADDDFSFREMEEDDVESEEPDEDEGRKMQGGGAERAAEASGRGELKMARSDEFAFPPTDPRYYKSAVSAFQEPRIIKEESGAAVVTNRPEILLSARNDDKFYTNDDYDQRTENDGEVVVAVRPHVQGIDSAGVYIIAIVAGISAAATVGLIAFAIGWYNLQKHVKNSADVEYPAYGVTGPNKEVSPSGDRKLAQSAQMYHYQHQKQQIIAMESRAATSDRHGSISEVDSDEENEEGDYTVYECPGLAPTGEMEVKNPLFQDDPTPAQTPQIKQNESSVQKK